MRVYCEADHERSDMRLDPMDDVWRCLRCRTAITSYLVEQLLPPEHRTQMGRMLAEGMLDARPYVVVRDPARPEVFYDRPSEDPQPEPRMSIAEALRIMGQGGD